MTDVKSKELNELKARIKVLEEENSILSANKEELLLIGMIAEQLEVQKNESRILDAVLEKISILKDIPLCVAFSIENRTARLLNEYSCFQESIINNIPIQISEKIFLQMRDGSFILDIEEFCDLSFICEMKIPFKAKSACIIPYASNLAEDRFFLFVFEHQSKTEVAGLMLLLQHIVEMTVAKIENVSLMHKLKKMNAELDFKVQEKTRELLQSNEQLKIQIEEQKQLREQFYQVQKMEAIGKLAGGIAHDFNNLLTVINGYTEILMVDINQKDKNYHELEQIHMAGKRAAKLTNQLLAFSRKQIIKPVSVDLNDIVSGAEKMLQRLIGENVFLQTILTPNLGNIMADPGQVEQVILNLVVNARDAMPKGGNINITTQNINLTSEDISAESDKNPGEYICLLVSDNGIGMDSELVTQIFEPFFTTKKAGEGTGLGLATVFGIVKQNKGIIKVDSVPGSGSTFKIYFPVVAKSAKVVSPDSEYARQTRKNCTIMVVEDDRNVQNFTVNVLKSAGYSILTADNAEIALTLLQKKNHEIDLLLTDVIMPGLSGKDLGDKVHELLPELKILYMSGYTADILANQGILTEEIEYLEKPFTPHLLLKRVEDVLQK